MQKRLVIGLALALSVAPLAARAALIGTSCDATQVGMTRMDTDQANIIACLSNLGSNPPTYQWKSMVGGDSDSRISCAGSGYYSTYSYICANSRGLCFAYPGSVGFNACLNAIGGGSLVISCASAEYSNGAEYSYMCANSRGSCFAFLGGAGTFAGFDACLNAISTP